MGRRFKLNRGDGGAKVAIVYKNAKKSMLSRRFPPPDALLYVIKFVTSGSCYALGLFIAYEQLRRQ